MSTDRKPLVLGALLALLGAAPAAKANINYTYTFLGNDYNFAQSPFSTSDFISASFTFASPLPDNLSLTNVTSSILSWTVTDQLFTLDPSYNGTFYLDVTTDSAGDIDSQDIFADTPDGLTDRIEVSYGPALYEISYDEATGAMAGIEGGSATATWTETTESTPEPSLLVPLGGATLLILIMRKRKTSLATQTHR